MTMRLALLLLSVILVQGCGKSEESSDPVVKSAATALVPAEADFADAYVGSWVPNGSFNGSPDVPSRIEIKADHTFTMTTGLAALTGKLAADGKSQVMKMDSDSAYTFEATAGEGRKMLSISAKRKSDDNLAIYVFNRA